MRRKCVYNGTILTMDINNGIIENGYIIIEDDTIVEIGKGDIPNSKFDEIIDADNGIIMPGFVNCHCHVSMTPFRSLGEDIPNRLMKYMIPMEDKLVDSNFVYVGAKVGIFEMILSGVTTFADMYYFENEVARACEEIGIRCIAGETIINKPCPDSDIAYGGLEYFDDFYERYKNSELITPALAPHATYTVDEEHLNIIKEISEKKDVPVLIHVAETLDEMGMFEEKNTTPVQFLNDIGLLSERVVAAHAIYVNDDDINILKEKKVGLAHCIAGNSKSGRALSPVPKMREKGIKIGFGTDGAMSGNHLDVIGLLGTYVRTHKLVNADIKICKAIEAVRIGTIEGATALNMGHKIGSLEVNKKADIIILETKSPNIIPVFDYYSALTYAAYPSNVVTSIINGKIVMKDRNICVDSYKEDMEKFIDLVKSIKQEAKELEAIALQSSL